MRRSSLNKHSPLPAIKSPVQEPKTAALDEATKLDDECNKGPATPATVIATSENTSTIVAESKPKATAGTGPTTNAYKLKDLPLEEVIT